MTEAIKREDAQKTFCFICRHQEKPCEYEMECQSLWALRKVPSAGSIPEWIPCEERLPKVGEEVLCQCRANIMEVLCLDEYGFWENPSSFRHYLNSFVIAWMPLPEPYEGEREDDE